MNKIHITNEDFYNMSAELCNKLLPIRDKIEWIVGIERGGIPLSTWLAHVFGKKHASVKISLYGDGDKKNDRNKSVVIDDNYQEYIHHPFAIIDDICDTSETISIFKNMMKVHSFPTQFWVATLYWCPENSPNNPPDFYVETKKASEWVVFPWPWEQEGNS